jgi:hypothetical protein
MRRMNTVASAWGGAVLLAAGLATAQITIYKQPDFTGGDRTIRESVTDLKGTGFNDQASSAVVKSGRWELCSQPEFKGDCMVLGPGEHARLDAKLFHRVESIREVQPAPVARNEPYGTAPIARGEPFGRDAYRDQRYSALEVYTEPAFRGRPLRFDRDDSFVERRRAEEGIASLVVNEGTWQVCSDADYRGRCRTFEPGRYPRMGRFENTPIGSLRRIG